MIHVEKTKQVLEPLFKAARARDEFEYACTLLRVRGLEMPGWDAMLESRRLIEDVMCMEALPLVADTKIRLALLLYSHVCEMGAPYQILGNMLRISAGERYSMNVFSPHANKGPIYPRDKILLLKKWAADLQFTGVDTLFDSFFENRIRNAFFHSSYVVHGGTMNITSGKGITINGVSTTKIPIETELLPRINGALGFVGGVLDLMHEAITAYTEPVKVMGRLGADDRLIEIVLRADPGRGLYGFTA